jgi:hypothetical protein
LVRQASKGPQAVARHPGIFRQSLLTKVLKHAFGGNSKTHLVANCSASADDLAETRSTLHFAEMATCIVNVVARNQKRTLSLEALRGQIQNMHVRSPSLSPSPSLLLLNQKRTLSLKALRGQIQNMHVRSRTSVRRHRKSARNPLNSSRHA